MKKKTFFCFRDFVRCNALVACAPKKAGKQEQMWLVIEKRKFREVSNIVLGLLEKVF